MYTKIVAFFNKCAPKNLKKKNTKTPPPKKPKKTQQRKNMQNSSFEK